MTNHCKAILRLIRLTQLILSANWSGKSVSDHRARAQWLQQQVIQGLEILQVQVHRQGAVPTHGLIVSNHLSYLDILVIASQAPAIFVAKSELFNWPMIGNLLRHAGTIMATRERPLKSAQTALEIQAALKRELLVVLFPEGTSTDGTSVQPFRSPLFQPAHAVSANIIPTAIAYTAKNTNPSSDICYWGDHTFGRHLIKLSTIQNIVAHIRFGSAQPCRADRKQSAAYFYTAVSRLHGELNRLSAD